MTNPDRRQGPVLSSLAATLVVAALLVLLAVVIVAGLLQGKLDPTGVALMLGTTLGGALLALLRDNDKHKGDK